MYIPDCHNPYIDERAWNRVLSFIDSSQPNRVVILGDFFDFYSVSRYDKLPGHPSLGEEIREGNWRLDQLQEVHSGPTEYEEGNHEARLSKYIARNASSLGIAVRDVPDLAHLEARGINWVPFGTPLFVDGVWSEHGDCASSKSGVTAHTMLAKRNVPRGVSAHSHRLALVHRTTPGIGVQQWAEAGSLCRTDKMDYTSFPDWQLGFAFLHRNGNLSTVLHDPAIN